MDAQQPHRIAKVRAGSPAARAGIRPGDELVTLNGQAVQDDIDYQFHSAMADLTLGYRRGGETVSVRIHKASETPLGLSFEGPLMKRVFTCRNKCIFCFEDQLPGGVRRSLREKDDDWRMSLLYGNFVTLTNISEKEWNRIRERRPSPLYVSVHATDPQVRTAMLGGSQRCGTAAGRLMEDLRRLERWGIRFHTQIVLCPGYNDGDILERTLEDLSGLESTLSVGIVPVGLTDHRQGLTRLMPVGPKEAAEVLRTVGAWQGRMRKARGDHWVYAADEFYILAGEKIPGLEAYDDLPQIENGIGMLSLLRQEIEDATVAEDDLGPKDAGVFRDTAGLEDAERTGDAAVPRDAGTAGDAKMAGGSGTAGDAATSAGDAAGRRVVLATGVSAAPYLRAWISAKGLRTRVRVEPIVNRFFGERITVAGLVVGRDIARQLGRPEEDEVLIPGCMLKVDEPIFLDDMTVEALSQSLGRPVRVIGADGQALVDAVLGRGGDVVDAADREADSGAGDRGDGMDAADREADSGAADREAGSGAGDREANSGAADREADSGAGDRLMPPPGPYRRVYKEEIGEGRTGRDE